MLISSIQLNPPADIFGTIGTLLLIVLAGLFTLRQNVVKILNSNYNAKEKECSIALEERDRERELKHEALTEVATLKMKLELERQKTDLTPAITMLSEMSATLNALVTKLG